MSTSSRWNKRSGTVKGSGFIRMASIRLNTAVVEPIPSAMVANAITEKVRFFNSRRTPKAMSCLSCSQPTVPRESRHSSLILFSRPIVTLARSRASAGGTPSAISSLVSHSRCSANSSSISPSTCDRRNAARNVSHDLWNQSICSSWR